ncbi:ribonuclease HII [Mycoplasma zalophidermidis]|uniref:Ribonuclease n=1 Tax=Mycoplasma zalophidermidis TaxID=398174 RepID=A0ABS6DQY9_9MOLU|nr:ribonuclease HII [Mycoplasma zalophidermidis]MBU4689537.1 ribonuclease HII [Mycoplasma zalophidermidis]MBU4693415.1 ribonuclease HII [Mycoplasma zalophidermidis]MCR8966288.1 ribonuclease HII [Mycoplasma zalophidermidis]
MEYKVNIELREFKNLKQVLGLDEAGRGCCAGPLVVAGVVFPPNYSSPLINDSKKLNAKQREIAFEQIKRDAIKYDIKFLTSIEVDKLNPKASSVKLMTEIANQFNDVDLVITDYEKLPNCTVKQLNLVKGDSKSLTVAAASILAKVSRDRYMDELDIKYPQYSFKTHKGYGTFKHKQAMEKYGLIPEHRKSYKNVKLAYETFLRNKE